MSMQIIDKKPKDRVPGHPMKHVYEFIILKVMTKKGTENDIGFRFKMNFFVITYLEARRFLPIYFFCYMNAVFINIYAL